MVEESTDWSALRTTISVTTAASDSQYSLTDCGDNVKVMSALNDTENCYLAYQTKDWFNEQLYINPVIEGAPRYYTFDGLDASGDTQVLVSPRPTEAQTLRFDVIKRQAELTANDDNLLVPEKPVIHLAGTSTAEYFAIADKYLSDAIAIDAAKHPEEMIFRTI
jgi:hypothetical protein